MPGEVYTTRGISLEVALFIAQLTGSAKRMPSGARHGLCGRLSKWWLMYWDTNIAAAMSSTWECCDAADDRARPVSYGSNTLGFAGSDAIMKRIKNTYRSGAIMEDSTDSLSASKKSHALRSGSAWRPILVGLRSNPVHVLLGAAIGCLLAGCNSSGNAPIQQTGSSTAKYVEAKRNLADDLEKALTGGHPSNYRLISISGPVYQIGAVLEPSDTVNLLSRSCLVPTDTLPSVDAWTNFPKWTSEKNVDLDVGLPAAIFSAIASAGVSFKNDHTGSFEFVDLSQQLLAQDELVKLLEKEDCAKATNGRDVLVIRGLVTGREILASGNTLSAGAHVKIIKSKAGDIKVAYDDNNSFELSDASPIAKFAIVSVLDGAARNGTTLDSLKRPDDATVERFNNQAAR
jgi:hypothetical protein